MDNSHARSAMTAIAVLVESGATPSSVTATLDLFRIAARLDPAAAIRLDLFSAEGGAVPLAEGLRIETRPLPLRLENYDAVILPGFFAEDLEQLSERLHHHWQPVIARLRDLPPATLVAGSCYGTFVLAESGLLDGRAATTSWWFQAVFAERYPKVRLNAAQALVDDGNVITAGAMTAHTDLSLHVLRRLRGHALARRVASIMLVDESKSSQRPFMALSRHFGDPLIDGAIEWMERHRVGSFSAACLAEELHVSYRTLHRRFCAVAGMAPLAYLQALRVEQAKVLLEETAQSTAQIAAAVGYEDDSAFRRIFTRLTGVTPAQYRKQFRRAASESET
jgi:transcriptional regulator GlxA family with amidase domain